MAVAVELGVEGSCALVRELVTAAPQNIIPPRYLTWAPLANGGLLIITDKAKFVVVAEELEGFGPTLARMIQRPLLGGMRGNC